MGVGGCPISLPNLFAVSLLSPTSAFNPTCKILTIIISTWHSYSSYFILALSFLLKIESWELGTSRQCRNFLVPSYPSPPAVLVPLVRRLEFLLSSSETWGTHFFLFVLKNPVKYGSRNCVFQSVQNIVCTLTTLQIKNV